MDPKVICIFTPDYAEATEGLQESARQFDVPVHAIPVPATGYLQYFTLKPRRIQNQLKDLQENESLLYLDSDNRFVERPDWSEFENVDFAVHLLTSKNPLPCAIFVRNTPECEQLIDRWIYLVESVPPAWFVEESALKRAMIEFPPKRMKTNIPRWCFSTLLRNEFGKTRPIVVHDMVGTRARLARR